MRLPSGPRRRARPGLGTLVDITIGDATDDARAEAAFEAAFATVALIHRLMSAHDPASDVCRLSEDAHHGPVRVDAHTLRVLRLARRMHRLSDGLFDLAIGAQSARAGRNNGLRDPLREPQGTTADIVIHAALRVSFRRPMQIDLGGIAKGYAVDCAVAALRTCRIGSALVNAGGDMRAFGASAQPVQLRFAGGVRTVAMLADAALASSSPAGFDPGAAPHIDPRSGRSVQSGQTVVVQAPSAALADALTKVALLCPRRADHLCAELGAEWRAFDFGTA